jgi:high-affinity iron transporter
MLSNTSAAGVLLHALMGYEAMPSGLQVVFYSTTLIVILSAMRILRNRKDTISSF